MSESRVLTLTVPCTCTRRILCERVRTPPALTVRTVITSPWVKSGLWAALHGGATTPCSAGRYSHGTASPRRPPKPPAMCGLVPSPLVAGRPRRRPGRAVPRFARSGRRGAFPLLRGGGAARSGAGAVSGGARGGPGAQARQGRERGRAVLLCPPPPTLALHTPLTSTPLASFCRAGPEPEWFRPDAQWPCRRSLHHDCLQTPPGPPAPARDACRHVRVRVRAPPRAAAGCRGRTPTRWPSRRTRRPPSCGTSSAAGSRSTPSSSRSATHHPPPFGDLPPCRAAHAWGQVCGGGACVARAVAMRALVCVRAG